MARVLQKVVPSVIRGSYARKWGLLLLVVGTLVAGCGYVAATTVASDVRTDVDDRYETRAAEEAHSLAVWDDSNREFTRTIGQTVDPGAVDSGTLEDLDRQADRVYSIHVVDISNGTLVATSEDRSAGTELSEVVNVSNPQRLFEDASAAGQLPVNRTGGYRTAGDQVPVLSYGSRASEDRGIVVTVRLAPVGQTETPDSEYTTIVLDRDQRVLFDDVQFGINNNQFQKRYDGTIPDPESAPGANRYDGDAGGQLLQSQYNFQGQPYIVGHARVDVGDETWTVLTHGSQREADSAVSSLDSNAFYGALLLGMLLFTGVGVVGGRTTARSVEALTEQTRQATEEQTEFAFETDRIDCLGRLVTAVDAMQETLHADLEEAEAGREAAERDRQRLQQANEEYEDTAQEYCRVIGLAADGDLTVRADTQTDNEQMAAIGAEFNGMLADIERTVDRLATFADDVATSSQEVTASSQEVRSASQQVTGSIQQISEGAKRQNTALESASHEMDELSTTTGQIASASNQVADLAEQTARTGLEARESAQSAIAGMSEIESESEQAVAEIQRLEEQVAQIDELIASIAEIADQTNMLALNANIEASRAQENTDGEGFGVVAEEVKELSNDVKAAAEEIEERLEGIREQTERTGDQVESTSDIVGNASSYVEEAVDALERIANYAKQTNDGVQEISAATQQQAASTQQVSTVVEEATRISARTTTEAEHVAAAAQEQTTSLTEVTKNAEDLADRAAELSDALDRFDTTEAQEESGTAPVESSGKREKMEQPGDEPDADDESTVADVDIADSVDFGGADEDD